MSLDENLLCKSNFQYLIYNLHSACHANGKFVLAKCSGFDLIRRVCGGGGEGAWRRKKSQSDKKYREKERKEQSINLTKMTIILL